jgi:hypothetical protein
VSRPPAAVAFCPGPPLLLPAVGVGADAALLSLRAACAAAVTSLLAAGPELVVVLGAGEAQVLDERAGGTFASWGVDFRVGAPAAAPRLSLPLAVGAWLLDQAGWRGRRRYLAVASAELALDLEPTSAPWGLLVVADGSATRTEKAPGSLHPEAAAFDASVASGLASGDAKALAAIDAKVGAGVLAGGVPAWHATAALIAGATYDAQLLADMAPYGVGYFVALWTAR